jgi:hypothetical protein
LQAKRPVFLFEPTIPAAKCLASPLTTLLQESHLEGTSMREIPEVITSALQMKMYVEYANIETRSRSQTTTKLGRYVTPKPFCEYIVALRHINDVTRPFSNFTQKLSQLVPTALRYDMTNAHTTLATFVDPNAQAQLPDQNILTKLSRAAAAIEMDIWQQIGIEFGPWLLTEDAVIVSGHPTPNNFWDAAVQLWLSAGYEGLPGLKMPWAAHMTAARFTAVLPCAEVSEIRDLLQSGPAFSQTRPAAIDIGWCQCSTTGFEIHTVDTIRL